MIESHAPLFGLNIWTFNLGDNRPILEAVFGVEGRSTTVLTLSAREVVSLFYGSWLVKVTVMGECACV